MPRVHTKTKAKQGQTYTCGKCCKPILPGDKYHQWSFRYGGTKFQHATCGYPKASQLTMSKMQPAYAAVEALDEDLTAARKANAGKGDATMIAPALRMCAEECDSVREDYEQGLENMGDSLSQGPTGQDMQEKVDALSEFSDRLNAAADEIDDLANEEKNDDETQEEFESRIVDEAFDKAYEVSGDLSV